MSVASPTQRAVWIATAIAWAASSAILLVAPAAPAVPAEAATSAGLPAVLAYSVAWLLFAPSIVLVSRLAAGRLVRFVGLAIGATAVVTGSPIWSSGFGVAGVSVWYAYGILVATMLLVPFAYAFARARENRLAAFCIALFLGIGFTAAGIGGLIALALFGALALRSAWFLQSSSLASPLAAPAGPAT